MTTFGALGIAGSGMNVYRHWLDAVSDNLANVNTVRSTDEAAFQARYVVAQSNDTQGGDTGGVHVAGAAFGDATDGSCTSPATPWPTPRATCATPTSTCPARWSN